MLRESGFGMNADYDGYDREEDRIYGFQAEEKAQIFEIEHLGLNSEISCKTFPISNLKRSE